MCRRYNSESVGLREEDVLLDDTHGGGRLPHWQFPPQAAAARLSQTPNSLGNVPTKGVFPRQRGLMAGNAMNAEPGNKALIIRDGRSSVMSPMTRHARAGAYYVEQQSVVDAVWSDSWLLLRRCSGISLGASACGGAPSRR
jgi:hypothetical protein